MNLTLDEQILRILTHPDVVLKRIDAEIKSKLLSIIVDNRKNNRELVINIIFGAYKPQQLPSPTIANWAEVFHLQFMIKLLTSITPLYPNTVVLEYILQDTYLSEFNSIQQSDINAYISSFIELVNFYNEKLMHKSINVRIDLKRESELIEYAALKRQMDIIYRQTKYHWQKNPDDDVCVAAIERAQRNYRGPDPTSKALFESALMHTAYIQAGIALDIRQGKNKILLVHRKIKPSGESTIPFRSCSSSAVQFWMGEGCLIRTHNKTFPTILSPARIKDYRLIETAPNSEFQSDNINLKTVSLYEKL